MSIGQERVHCRRRNYTVERVSIAQDHTLTMLAYAAGLVAALPARIPEEPKHRDFVFCILSYRCGEQGLL